MATRKRELEKRGEKFAKTPEENEQFKKECSDRGGIVFVSPEAEKELNGPVI